jgi:hypothetical protein
MHVERKTVQLSDGRKIEHDVKVYMPHRPRLASREVRCSICGATIAVGDEIYFYRLYGRNRVSHYRCDVLGEEN